MASHEAPWNTFQRNGCEDRIGHEAPPTRPRTHEAGYPRAALERCDGTNRHGVWEPM